MKDGIRACKMDSSQKMINCAAQSFDILEYTLYRLRGCKDIKGHLTYILKLLGLMNVFHKNLHKRASS